MKRINVWLLIFILGLITIGGFTLKRSNAKSSVLSNKTRLLTKVDAFIVKPSLLVDEISVSGTLLPFEEVELKNEVAGRVVNINLPEGRFVKQGTLLVKLFDDDLQANLEKLQTQLAIQEQIYQRQSELLKANGISQNDYEQTVLQINSIKADIQVEKVLIRKTEVLAPFDGVIGLRSISLGAEVTPSNSLATIRSVSKLKLDFSVPEKYSQEITTGMKVRFTLYDNDKQYNATVFATEEGSDALTHNLKIRAVIDNQSENLLPGAFCHILLRLNENKNALMIPTQAIIPQEDTKSIIVSRKGKAHFITVGTGVRKASKIEITGGVQPGDTVITTGIMFIKEGTRLSFNVIKSDTI